ncbi:MAG TPA: hypothetical protein VG317_16275 [Pseudonocardiaceae bacterium]|nr:hypothetical protein [Pseudonocardiaceae bacterium]
MSEKDELPAEVRAARRAVGKLGQQGEPASAVVASAVTSTPPISRVVDDLFDEILSADQVDIVGVLPWQCASRLIELANQRRVDGQRVINPAAVRYFTPASDRITVYRHPGTIGTLVQRWEAGITGLRNWLRSSRTSSDEPEPPSVYEFDDIYLGCLICAVRRNQPTMAMLSLLPSVSVTETEGSAGESALILTRMSDEQIPVFREYLRKLESRARPMTPRQILCRLDQETTSGVEPGSEFRPVVARLHPKYTSSPPNTVSATAVVAVCAPTARGTEVVLKLRTPRNAMDDLDKLSLISERVVTEDLLAPLGGPLDVDHGRALDDLWLRAGQPNPFEIPESAFRHTAQRELFLTCGLDVPDERLELRGTCLLEREGENRFLGFYVYRLDLNRTPADEYSHAMKWNSDLRPMLLDELYQPANRSRLNRLLRLREAWLREAVFGRPTGKSERGATR